MNAKERGFLLLTSQLGDPERRPLTVAQFRTLAQRVTQMQRPGIDRDLKAADLMALGYDRALSERILQLLQEEERLEWYLRRGLRRDCVPLSRISEDYPGALRQRLGPDAPGCLWAKGDVSLLSAQMVALVGSRDVQAPNRAFAETVGREAALQGKTLVSGNARGSDRAAQDACLAAGGKVISVVADELEKAPLCKDVLYLSEDSFDLPFSSQRAISRNRVIHGLGYVTFIAQSDVGTGGTWNGTVKNLRQSWSPVFCFDDGSAASRELEQLGAMLISPEQVSQMAELQSKTEHFL